MAIPEMQVAGSSGAKRSILFPVNITHDVTKIAVRYKGHRRETKRERRNFISLYREVSHVS